MAICWVESTTNPTLQKYLEDFGQREGLERFIKELAGTDVIADYAASIVNPDTEDIGYGKVVQHLTKTLRTKYDRLDKANIALKNANKADDLDKVRRYKKIKTKLIEDIGILKEQIEQTKNADDVKILEEIANKQLDWLNALFEQETLSESEITEANNVIDTWSNIKDILFDKDEIIGEGALEILSRIENRINSEDFSRKWWNAMGDYLAVLGKYKDSQTLFTDFYKLEDISSLRGWILGASDTGIKLIGETDRAIRNSLNRADVEKAAWSKKIKDSFKILRDKGKYDDFVDLTFQRNAKGEISEDAGMVGEYSQVYWDSIKKLSGNARKAFYMSKNDPTNKKAQTLAKKALSAKNKWLRENTIHVDVRFFKDPNFITESGKSFESHKKELIEVLGKDKAERAIQQAKDRYTEFLDTREDANTYFEDEIASGTIKIPEGVTKEAHLADLMEEWDLKNNPEVWFRQAEPGNTTFTQYANKWTYTIPRRIGLDGKETGYYDKNYEKIMSDPDMVESFNLTKEFMDTMLEGIPPYLKQNIQSNFLPRIKKDLVREFTLKGSLGAITALYDRFKDSLTSREGTSHNEIDPTTGQPYKQPPLIGLSPVELAERSMDLEKILMVFGESALNYKYKADVLDKVMVVNKFLEMISKNKNRKEFTNDELPLLRNMLDYTVDALIFENARKEEGVIKQWRFFKGNAVLVKDKALELEIDAELQTLRKKKAGEDAFRIIKEKYGDAVEIVSQKAKYKQLEKQKADLEEKLFNKEITEEQFDEAVKPIEAEANKLGKSVVASRVGDAGMKLVQAQAFWFNPFSAFNNYMFGITSTAMWASGGRDFTTKEFRRSFGVITKSMFKLKDKQLDKAANMIIKYNALSESRDFKTDKGNESLNKISNWPYILLTKGDYFIKGQTLVALMMYKKVTTKSGEQISLWEAYNDDGTFRRELFDDETNNLWDGDARQETHLGEYLAFKNKADAVIKKLHGNFDPKSPSLHKKYVLGRMIGQFRASWVGVGIEQRFGQRQMDPYLEREVEGRYRTAFTLGFSKSIKILTRLALGSYYKGDPLQGIRSQDRAIVEENMRKNLMEIYIYSVIFAILLTMKHMSKGGDEDDSKYKLVYNMLWRVMGETTFYLSPKTFVEIVRDPLPILQLAKRARGLQTGIVDLLFEEDLTDSEKERSIAKITNTLPAVNNFNKFIYATQRLR